MRILLVDFYDSFTFNLLHYIEMQGVEVDVVRNDALIDELMLSKYSHVILSPGPGLPSEKANLDLILNYCISKTPVLGICLGMQAIGSLMGGKLENMGSVKHGVAEVIRVDNSKVLFRGLPHEFEVGLYHSWCVTDIPTENVCATSSNGTIMGISSVEKKLFGVQFHPESILSDYGHEILKNFINV
ncbi:MAG: aminodeoxychorismate/anthranilate synthase component II [Crocinitomicaceae bacterium]|nr:aminodeoxychorismate/anthranilate synthase component II [Crocinitomicaceae bacterium]MDG2505416.1 aminodeoxychorismate/anthranilate synthase component II [Crocinitomicaceae bacterium]